MTAGRLTCTWYLVGLVQLVPYDSAHHSSDTGSHNGFLGVDQTRPATMWVSTSFRFFEGLGSLLNQLRYSYAFDVDPHTQVFMNRRVFAYVDTGVPDGIQVDAKGNVYSGCGDGVQVRSLPFFLFAKYRYQLFVHRFGTNRAR